MEGNEIGNNTGMWYSQEITLKKHELTLTYSAQVSIVAVLLTLLLYFNPDGNKRSYILNKPALLASGFFTCVTFCYHQTLTVNSVQIEIIVLQSLLPTLKKIFGATQNFWRTTVKILEERP